MLALFKICFSWAADKLFKKLMVILSKNVAKHSGVTAELNNTFKFYKRQSLLINNHFLVP